MEISLFQRMRFRTGLIIMLLLQFADSISQNELNELIVDYIDYKNSSRLLTAFICLPDFETVSLIRRLADASISVTIINPMRISERIKNSFLFSLLRYDYNVLNVVADLECEGTNELMTEISLNKAFNYSYAWLLLSSSKSFALESMASFNLSVDADVVAAITSSQDSDVQLYDLFNTGSDRCGIFNATLIGSWKTPRNLNVISLQSFVYRRKNLTGIILRFATVTAYMDPGERDVIEYLSNIANKNYDTISKINFALNLAARDFYNYSMEISTWTDYGGKWNGPFFGMMGALGREEADFTLGGTVITEERLEYCTPVVQNYPFWTGFLFKHPTSRSIRNVFLAPLTPSTWTAILTVCILVALILSLAIYCRRKDGENPCSFGVHLTLSTLFQQGWSNAPPGPSGHILLFTFVVFSMLLHNFYGASIVSSLLSDPPQSIRTIADLLETGMPAAYENASYVPHYFRISTVPAERSFYEKRLIDKGKPKVLPRPEGIKRVKAGGFAYHTTPSEAYEEIAREFTQPEICRLAEITFIRKSVLALWGSRENPYREHLKIIHRRLEEVGILAREQKRWSAPRPECLGGLTTLNSIALHDVAPAFIGLSCGVLASILILSIEIFYHYLRRRR